MLQHIKEHSIFNTSTDSPKSVKYRLVQQPKIGEYTMREYDLTRYVNFAAFVKNAQHFTTY